MTPAQIKEARQMMGLTAAEFALHLGYSRIATIYDIEAGRIKPSKAVVMLLRQMITNGRTEK